MVRTKCNVGSATLFGTIYWLLKPIFRHVRTQKLLLFMRCIIKLATQIKLFSDSG